jgi:hypothetical protein
MSKTIRFALLLGMALGVAGAAPALAQSYDNGPVDNTSASTSYPGYAEQAVNVRYTSHAAHSRAQARTRREHDNPRRAYGSGDFSDYPNPRHCIPNNAGDISSAFPSWELC